MFKSLCTILAAVGLTACLPQVEPFEIQDLTLYGLQEQHVFFFGAAGTTAKRDWKIAGRNISLSNDSSTGALAVPGAWSVEGKPSLLLKPNALKEVMTLSALPFSGELGLLTRNALEAVVYWDGQNWFDVSGKIEANQKIRIKPTRRSNLRGLGQLTEPLADALAGYLSSKGRVAVALLRSEDTPSLAASLEPLPNRYASTALYVQVGLQTDLLGGFAQMAPIELKALSAGSGAYTGDQSLVRLDANQAALNETWKLVAGNQLPQPSPPDVDFKKSKVVSFFLGQRPTGGYGVAMADAKLEGKTLVLNVNLREPGPGQILTQAITSPYASALVFNTDFSSVRVVNKANGKTLAQTK